MSSPEFSDDKDALIARIDTLEIKLSAGCMPPPEPGGAKKIEAAAKTERKQPDEDAPEDGAKPWKYWNEALAKIKDTSKTLYMYMMGARVTECGGRIEIELKDAYAYEVVSKPGGIPYLSDLFKSVSGESHEVIAYEKGKRPELSEKGSGSVRAGASIDDIIAKKKLFGDKMNITE